MSDILYFFRYRKHRNSRFGYYAKNIIGYIMPAFIYRITLKRRLSLFERLDDAQKEMVIKRVNYYNRLNPGTDLPCETAPDGSECVDFGRIKLNAIINGRKSKSMYVLDSYYHTKYFSKKFRAGFLFGDITHVPLTPSFVKSRPVKGDNTNSVLLPLVKVRHFTFVNDRRGFSTKKSMLVGRAFVDQPHRIKFWELYFNHPMCNLGNTNAKLTSHPEWLVKPMPIDEHLEYKFILCLNGNDVASNLKWVMSSNSLAVMSEPPYETWFMDGTLIPNYHYVSIKPDFSDLEERLNYYIEHEDEALSIIRNANAYVNQFRNRKIEKLIGLMVVNKYLENTGQL